jgi:hypothetical protein
MHQTFHLRSEIKIHHLVLAVPPIISSRFNLLRLLMVATSDLIQSISCRGQIAQHLFSSSTEMLGLEIPRSNSPPTTRRSLDIISLPWVERSHLSMPEEQAENPAPWQRQPSDRLPDSSTVQDRADVQRSVVAPAIAAQRLGQPRELVFAQLARILRPAAVETARPCSAALSLFLDVAQRSPALSPQERELR